MKKPLFAAVFDLSGMTCGSCVARVQERMTHLEGVSRVEVTLEPPQVRLAGERAVAAEELNAWLAPVGRYLATAVDGVERASRRAPAPSALATYRPLLLVLGYLVAVVAVANFALGRFDAALSMQWFMGGFFVVFSFFKMLDLRGFASAYREYDMVAKALPVWGRLYPFVELGLGLAYLAGWKLPWVNAVTAVVMAASLVGVMRAVFKKQKIRCACLGTGFNLPMSTVTIIEDGAMLTMALMALGVKH
jgi:copper chaperone CopZ